MTDIPTLTFADCDNGDMIELRCHRIVIKIDPHYAFRISGNSCAEITYVTEADFLRRLATRRNMIQEVLANC